MASQTRRFGFTVFDSPADEINFQNYKFSDADRLLLDRLLRVAIEDHVHTGASATTSAPSAPRLTSDPKNGSIPANATAYYRYSIVDARGQETAASALANLTTPVPATAPGFGPRLSADLGFMEAGQYSYAVSACTNDDPSQETTVGPLATGTLTDYGGWRLDLPPVPSGAQFFNVYRKGPRETELLYWSTTTPEQRAIVDDGSIKTVPSRKAPQANTTNSSNSITIELPGPYPEGSWTWKVFRTYDPGNWENSFLAWNDGYIYTDDGRATQPGFPPGASVAVGGAPKIDLARDVEGTPSHQSVNAIARSVNLNANRASEGPATWAWVNEYESARLMVMQATLGRDTPEPTRRLEVGIDVRQDGTNWTPVGYLNEPASVASINPGQLSGPPTDISPHNVYLLPGHEMRLHVWQPGHDDVPPLDQIHDLTLVVTMFVRGPQTDDSYTWEIT